MIRRRICRVAVGLLLLTGCAGVGPGTIDRDHFDYTTAIAESWKSQMLLNIVKVRYGDAPVFLDAASVINQYVVQGRVKLGASWNTGLAGRTALRWESRAFTASSTGRRMNWWQRASPCFLRASARPERRWWAPRRVGRPIGAAGGQGHSRSACEVP